jgi:hypothetical protein
MFKLSVIWRGIYLFSLRWRIRLRYLSGLQKLSIWTCALFVCGIPLWKHFGTDASLAILADATPILLAVVGVVMSYEQPKKDSHLATTVILFAAGLAGSIVLTLNRLHSETTHRIEVKTLGVKIDAVGTQNTKLSNFLIEARTTGKMSELDRRKGIESTLRSEYILSHNPVDPQILAGNAQLPQEWENRRLADLGEKWTVSAAPKIVPSEAGTQAPELEKPRLLFTLWDEKAGVDDPVLLKYIAPDHDGNFPVEFAITNPSEVAAESPEIWLKICDGCSFVGEPTGFDRPVGMEERSRHKSWMTQNPGTSTEKFTVLIKRSENSAFQIGIHYACKNCGKLADYQLATIVPLGGIPVRTFKLHSPSTFYTPKVEPTDKH